MDFYHPWRHLTACEYCHRRINRKEDVDMLILGDDFYHNGARLCSPKCLLGFLTVTVKICHNAPYYSKDRYLDHRGKYQCLKCKNKVTYGLFIYQSGFSEIQTGFYCSYECVYSAGCSTHF